MAIPTLVSVGTVAQGASGTPGVPAGTATDDILLLFVGTGDGNTITVSGGNQTWTQVTNSPVDDGVQARLGVYWARRGATTPTMPTVSTSGTSMNARVAAYNGVINSGNPFETSAASTEATADTSGSATGVTTALANSLIVISEAGAVVSNVTTSTAEYSGWTNANLSSVTERIDNRFHHSNLYAVMLGVADGGKAAAGATGATTFTHATSTTKAMLVIALKQAIASVDGIVLDLKWDLAAAVDGIVEDLVWDLRAAVNGIVLDLIWDLFSGAPVDGPVLDLLWDLRAAVERSLTLDWELFAIFPTIMRAQRALPSSLAIELVVDQTSAGFNPFIVSQDSFGATGSDAAGVGTLAWSNPTKAQTQNADGATVSLGDSSIVSTPIYEMQQVQHSDSRVEAGSVCENYSLGANAWGSEGNAKSLDNFYAAAQLPGNQGSDLLRMHAFGFATQGTITGVLAKIYHRVVQGGGAVWDSAVRLGDHPTLLGSNKAKTTLWTTTRTLATYGGVSDNWSAGLTPSIVNGNAFSLYAAAASHNANGELLTEIDFMSLELHWVWTTTEQVQVGSTDETVFSSETSHYLKVLDYSSLAIPSGANITGIKVTVTARSTDKTTGEGTFNEDIIDSRISLVKGGTIQSTNKALSAALSKDAYGDRVYGGPSDLWGTTWTDSDVNGSTFGVVYSVTGGPAVADVDDIKVTVYYTEAGQEVEVTGSPAVRFGPEESRPERRILSAGFRKTMPGGYDSADFSIGRPEFFDPLDYLNGRARFYEYESDKTWYEGRIVGASDSGNEVGFELEGYARSLEDIKTIRMPFYDRDLSNWSGPSVQRKLNELAASRIAEDGSATSDLSTGAPAVELSIDSPWAAASLGEAEAVYDARVALGFLDYAWKKSSTVPAAGAEHWEARLEDDDIGTNVNNSGDLQAAGPGSGTVTASGATKKFARVRLYASAADATDGTTFTIFFTLLAVVGAHGIALQGSVAAPNTGRGILASDVFTYSINTWAPLLDLGEIEVTTFAIPHLSFLSETTALAIVEAICLFGGTSFLPLDWWVGEGRKAHLASPENHGQTWRVRLSEGVQSSGQGPDVQSMLTGVVVRYDDGTGTTHSVGPPGSGADVETTDLIDTSDSNPANRDGADHWELWDANITSLGGATLIGQAIMNARNQMTWRGSMTIPGGMGVRDSMSTRHETAEVDAGDYLVAEDDDDTRPRRINGTAWDMNGNLVCDIGAPSDRLDALLARLSVVLVGRL